MNVLATIQEESTMIPTLEFESFQPANLHSILEAQVRCLISRGVPYRVGVDQAKFLDDAMGKVKRFTYSTWLSVVGLDRVCVVHYGVSNRYLAEASGVTPWADPDKFTLYERDVLPEGIHIIQSQFGLKHKGRTPRQVRSSHDALERLGVPSEGLTAYLYWGEVILKESFQYYPGVMIDPNLVLCLHDSDKGPVLRTIESDHVDHRYGSVSSVCMC